LSSSLADQGHPVTLINAGVSGDTTAGGLARLDWALTPETEIVIIILGGNDALRAIAPSQTEQNLDALLTDLATRGLKVLLTGMRAPPNLGPEFASEFEPIYARLATKHDVALFPFVLEGVAADPTLNQDDGIHPNKDGVSTIVRNILPYLLPLLNGANQTE
jgi:acyl-CoA thioesterase-1